MFLLSSFLSEHYRLKFSSDLIPIVNSLKIVSTRYRCRLYLLRNKFSTLCECELKTFMIILCMHCAPREVSEREKNTYKPQ